METGRVYLSGSTLGQRGCVQRRDNCESEDEDEENGKNQYISDLSCGDGGCDQYCGRPDCAYAAPSGLSGQYRDDSDRGCAGTLVWDAPNLLSGIFMGMTVDIYSLYFAPVGMITGIMSGILLHAEPAGRPAKRGWIFLKGLGVSVPGTVMSAAINAALFGGVTSSGSTVIVQLLARTPLGLAGKYFRRAVSDGLYRPLYFDFCGERGCSAGFRRAAPKDEGREIGKWKDTV